MLNFCARNKLSANWAAQKYMDSPLMSSQLISY